jgi:hypothetical protein
MLQKIFKKMLGLDKLEQKLIETQEEINAAKKIAAQHTLEAADAEEKAGQAKMTPKERANAKGEAWVSVLDTKVNPDNIRNGFFELDWNDQFVLQLKQNGYGFDGDPEEEIVDRWFRDIVRQMLDAEGQDPTRGAGYINVVPLSQGKSEVS